MTTSPTPEHLTPSPEPQHQAPDLQPERLPPAEWKRLKAALRQVSDQIADALGETEQDPRKHVHSVVLILGEERSRALLGEALAAEAASGMMLRDGSRRRTLGGVFFYLARQQMTPAERARAGYSKKPKKAKKEGAAPASATPSPFTAADYGALVAEIYTELGEARTVKITLVGRPGTIATRDQFVSFGMRATKVPALPKGLPEPTGEPVPYMVLVARKQWDKVATSLNDPEDVLIVEGYPSVDPRFPQGITVHATQTTTKILQRVIRELQAASNKGESS